MTFDELAYAHHFEHDHCGYQNGVPLPMILCDRHGARCPLEDPVVRHGDYGPKGWPSERQRECSPLYVYRGGSARTRPRDAAEHLDDCEPDCDQPHTAGWFTLGGGAKESRPRLQAPRLPAKPVRRNPHAVG